MKELSDNSLMLKVKAGDLDKLGLLFERYQQALYGFLYRMSQEKELSEDMVQTVFYRMLKYRNSFKGTGEFRTWMYHLARNVLADEMKKNKKHMDVGDFTESIGGGELADDAMHKKQALDLLQNAMNRLNPEYKEVLVLSRYQELKYAEIAKILNTSEGNVKVKIHRAIKQLQEKYFNVAKNEK